MKFQGAPGLDTLRRDTMITTRQLHRESPLSVVPREELRLFGVQVPSTVQICVGLSAVSRQKDYVLETIQNMLGKEGSHNVLGASERSRIVIVAHLADFASDWVVRIAKKLQEDHVELVASGQLHGIHTPPDRYPKLDVCPPLCSFNNDPKRVAWRSKQNIDYALLMHYAAPLATYYLQLEDDIAFAPNWVQKITEYLTTKYPPLEGEYSLAGHQLRRHRLHWQTVRVQGTSSNGSTLITLL